MQQGKVHAGLTRVVWELNNVAPGDGAIVRCAFSRFACTSVPNLNSLPIPGAF